MKLGGSCLRGLGSRSRSLECDLLCCMPHGIDMEQLSCHRQEIVQELGIGRESSCGRS